jgi:Protein of unknown function (DUF5672)
MITTFAFIFLLVTAAQSARDTPLHRHRTRHALPTRYAALTVVHANCSTLSLTISNMAGVLGPDWPITIYYTESTRASVTEDRVVSRLVSSGRVGLFPLSRLGFNELPHGNIGSYSKLMTAASFWDTVHADRVLVFQTDSVLCSLSQYTVDDFLQYDYIGAPFAIRWANLPDWMESGNGGLSLRNVTLMRHIIRLYPYKGEAEDGYFATAIHDMQEKGEPVTPAPLDAARAFSYESGPAPGNMTFGVHRYDGVDAETRKIIQSKCPEAALGVWGACGRTEAVQQLPQEPFAAG